ncbi:UPF0481 protein At3g47200-like [Quercus lobata]|uniref:Uncharacterized protein n=1 Tax=Quercus lobata TaxID=97700 RepID=A0A7N2R2W9_QUELO|nr:UPF0481 protein At3g47200-like [Quercus lobata]
MEMVPIAATDSHENDHMCKELGIDITIVMDNDLICDESIIDVLAAMEPARWSECCIYRTPWKIRKINKEAYTPKVISIGPFHHGGNEVRDEDSQKELRDMETLKVRKLKEFCDRTGKCQKEIAGIIEKNQDKIRRCYSESFDISKEDFMKMVLLDSTFIIEVLLRADDREKYKDDFTVSNPMVDDNIRLDLILLENQLPFFILKELYEKSYERHSEKPIFQLACKYFSRYIKKNPEGEKVEKVKHFTDLIRLSYCPDNLEFNVRKKNPCTATKLYETGVIFKLHEGSLDIHFHKSLSTKTSPCLNFSWLLKCLLGLTGFGCLEHTQPLLKIPRFIIDDDTEGLLRNIMLLEQCHYPFEAFVCNHMWILDYLINSKEDVELLIEKNIIYNDLGSNEVIAEMVNKLCIEISERKSCYADLAEDLCDHYAQHCNRSMGYLRRTYFPNLWRTTVTVVGLIVFGFTFWTTIRPYVAPKIDSVHCV